MNNDVTYTVPLTLGYDSQARKDTPLLAVVFGYFAAAMAGLTRHAVRSNEKHNPGEPLHWSRGKSTDHPECVLRHLVDAEEIKAWLRRNSEHPQRSEVLTMLEHEYDARVWRAAADSQEFYEEFRGAPLSFSSREYVARPGDRVTPTGTRPAPAYTFTDEGPYPHPAGDVKFTTRGAPLIDYSHEIPLIPDKTPQCKAQRGNIFKACGVEYCLLPEDHEGDHCGPFSNWPAVAFPQEQADTGADEIVGQITGTPLHGPAGADWRERGIARDDHGDTALVR